MEQKKIVYLETKDHSTEFMKTLRTKQLVMHNGLFDVGMIQRNYQVNLKDALFCDTMVLAHLLDENRRIGLKELGAAKYGESAKQEQKEMAESVARNGGELTKKNYELYKGDADLIAKYGAKDTILTFNLFFEFMQELYDEKLDDFFFTESMPLLRGPTYDLNNTGLRVDVAKLADLKRQLEIEILDLRAYIYKEIDPLTKAEYPGTNKKNTFNIGSGSQLAWLLFHKLGNTFPKVSKAGQEVARALSLRTPYSKRDKKEFIEHVQSIKGQVWRQKGEVWDPKTRKHKGEGKARDYWCYLATDKIALKSFASKYKWVEKLLEYKKLDKLLTTYVEGIQNGTRYGIIRPDFLQTGTTSGRYSCRRPNFQNLPRDDKRIKSCIISRPGKVFVGADYSQLEPRVFASYSQDKRLMECFTKGDDFYSTVGMPMYGKTDASLSKKDPNYFGEKYKELRDIAKMVALSIPYGTTKNKLAMSLNIDANEAQDIIDLYFSNFPSVEVMMLEAHELVKQQGYVENLFGRKRRIPDAKDIKRIYGNTPHNELPYQIRGYLNLACNHRIQSTGASIVNRAAIRFKELCESAKLNVQVVTQIHDELVAECWDKDAETVAALLKEAMENTVTLPGVGLVAEPKIAKNLADLK